jgi:hypothetical protein
MQDVNLVLADRYQARERLGSGAGTGVEEYLGRDLRLARSVVIQVIRGAGEDGFAPQARLMASLDHPAVASVYDWGQQGELAYLIREYVPGQNLGRLLIERGVMPAAQAAAIGAEVAAALAAAHRIGLAHGSLDAADVILGDQRVTVVGFGAAWIREVAGAAGPDATGDHDPQADLCALGGMLYQMVTGASPEQWPAVAPPAGGALPAQLRQVIARLMATGPDERYQAAEVVRADLLHLAHERPVPASPGGTSPAGATQASAGPTDSTAPVRLVDPPSWVSDDQAGPDGDAARGRAGRRRRHWTGLWGGILLGMVLLVGAVAGALLLTRDPGGSAIVRPPGSTPTTTGATTPVDLPDVVGQDEHDATAVLQQRGFVANVSRRTSEQTAGVVIGQSPGAGERPPRGAIVFLTVSSGPAAHS